MRPSRSASSCCRSRRRAAKASAPAEQPGLDEEAAAYAVLGVDVEAFGIAATRQWGLGDEVLHMIRRLPADAPVRKPDGDDELLRIVASAANEAVDALELPPTKVSAALNEVVVRYARTLRLTTRSSTTPCARRRARCKRDGRTSMLRRQRRRGADELARGGRRRRRDDRGGSSASSTAELAATATTRAQQPADDERVAPGDARRARRGRNAESTKGDRMARGRRVLREHSRQRSAIVNPSD